MREKKIEHGFLNINQDKENELYQLCPFGEKFSKNIFFEDKIYPISISIPFSCVKTRIEIDLSYLLENCVSLDHFLIIWLSYLKNISCMFNNCSPLICVYGIQLR